MNTITQLLEKWEARSRGATPCDAMLINKHIRELREAVARPQFAGFDVVVDPTMSPNEMKLVPAAASVNCDELRAAICGIGVVGKIAGHDVIVRESVIDLIDRRRSAAAPGAKS